MIQYRMNTFKGSGGSPIFKERNGELCLIAMHIGNQGSKKFNFGVRISEVLKDIKEKDHSPSKKYKYVLNHSTTQMQLVTYVHIHIPMHHKLKGCGKRCTIYYFIGAFMATCSIPAVVSHFNHS